MGFKAQFFIAEVVLHKFKIVLYRNKWLAGCTIIYKYWSSGK